jgi:F-type H+-transporting ATPase subunit b
MNINITLVAQLVVFAIFWWFSRKYVWDPIMSVLNERKQGIADSLADAERGRQELEQAEQKSQEFVTDAKKQASDIVANAEKRGSGVVEEARDTAKSEGERILTAAHAEIEQDANRAREALRTEVAALAAAGASKIINKEINADTHAGLIDDLISELQADG